MKYSPIMDCKIPENFWDGTMKKSGWACDNNI